MATDIHAPLVEDESASPDMSGPTMESTLMRVAVNATTTVHVVITIPPRNSSTTIRSWQIITLLIIIRQISLSQNVSQNHYAPFLLNMSGSATP